MSSGGPLIKKPRLAAAAQDSFLSHLYRSQGNVSFSGQRVQPAGRELVLGEKRLFHRDLGDPELAPWLCL